MTKIAAGMMCIAVRAACAENPASKDVIRAGATVRGHNQFSEPTCDHGKGNGHADPKPPEKPERIAGISRFLLHTAEYGSDADLKQ